MIDINDLQNRLMALQEIMKDIALKVERLENEIPRIYNGEQLALMARSENKKLQEYIEEVIKLYVKSDSVLENDIIALQLKFDKSLVDYSDIQEIHRILHEHYKCLLKIGAFDSHDESLNCLFCNGTGKKKIISFNIK